MDRDSIFCAHVLKHPPQPVIGDGGDQVGHDSELGTAKCRGDGVAAERYRVSRCDVLLVAGRHVVGNEGDIDIGLSDEEGLHNFSVWLRVIPAGVATLAPDFAGYLQNLFAKAPPVSLEIGMWPDYDRPYAFSAVPVLGRTRFLRATKGRQR